MVSIGQLMGSERVEKGGFLMQPEECSQLALVIGSTRGWAEGVADGRILQFN